RQQPQRVAGGTSSQAFDGNGGAFLACRAIEHGCLVYRISDNARERRRVRSRTVERRKQGREREPDWLYKKHLRSAGGSMADRPTKTAPYGSWRSPITSDLIVAQSIALSEVRLDSGDVYWVEGRPQEQGRQVVVRGGAQSSDVTPPPFNARTRVHEYGGGAWT